MMVNVRLGSIFHKLGQLFGKLPDVAVLVSEELLLVVSDKVGMSRDTVVLSPIVMDKLLSVLVQ